MEATTSGQWFQALSSESDVRGLGRSGRFAARRFGLLGRCEEAQSRLEGLVLAEALDRLHDDPVFRRQAREELLGFVIDNPARVSGRVLTGVSISFGLSKLTPIGPGLGILLPGTSVHGDVRSALEAGADDLPGLAAAVAGGLPDDAASLFEACGCTR